jgi:hypothetical protein
MFILLCEREKRGTYRIYWGNLRKRDNLEELDVDGKIILK